MGKYVIFSYETLNSTNDKAWELLIQKQVRLPFVVRTKSQISGRGRYGRKWISEEGGLYFSIAEVGRFNNELLVCTTLAIYNTLKRFGIEGRIILPNDLYTKKGKIAGILIERRGAYTVNGIGINVNQETFPKMDRPVTSMFLETNHRYNIDEILTYFLDEYFHLDYDYAFSTWREIVMRENRKLKVFTRFTVGDYFLKEIDRELNLYFDDLPFNKNHINLFDVIKIDTQDSDN